MNPSKHSDTWTIPLLSNFLARNSNTFFFPGEEDIASFAFSQIKMKSEVIFHTAG